MSEQDIANIITIEPVSEVGNLVFDA